VRILYLAPDAVPAPKGAAVRIERTVAALRALGHDVEMLTPSRAAPATPDNGDAGAGERNFLARMLAFRAEAARWLAGRQADVVQFRSIWEGAPALAWARRTGARAVFEAHGFPSVELPYHFPGLSGHAVLDKLIAEERAVLAAAAHVVVPSRTSARFVHRLGVPPARVSVIPNVVDPDLFSPPAVPPPDEPPHRLVYVGTLAPWQGLDTLLEALALLRHRRTLELHVVGPLKTAWGRALRQQARRLRVQDAVHQSGPMAQADLAPVLRTAHACVAPLPADARNALQGCCPIKLLEYMAAGRPILATRIAPVEEVLEDGVTAHLVRPGSAAALADGIGWLLDHPAEREAQAAAARAAALAAWTPAHFRERVRRLVAALTPAAPAVL
jgi:glycosyltransferase involved in cell wall biosynthesis